MYEDFELTRAQQTASLLVDRIISHAERAAWLSNRATAVPIRVIVRVVFELTATRRFPRIMAAVVVARRFGDATESLLVESRIASSWLARRLAATPQRTQRVLHRLHFAARVTHPLHRVHIRLPLGGARLEAVDLDGVRSGLLEGAYLSRATLTDVRLFGSLRGANLDGSRIRRTSFVGTSLNDASFDGAELNDVIIASGTAARCSFKGAHLTNCTLVELSLCGARFTDASLCEVRFDRCDFTGAEMAPLECDDVAFIECENVPSTFAYESRRTVVGANPRTFSRSADVPGDRSSVSSRYTTALTESIPPIGYRLQTLARNLLIWISLGAHYAEAREQLLAAAGPKVADFLLPRRRLRNVIRLLTGVEYDIAGLSGFVASQYDDAVAQLREHCATGALDPLPELVITDGNRPRAALVDSGAERYLVVNVGLVVMTIRVARYCIAWVLPHAISHLDVWPDSRDSASIRVQLAENLAVFAAGSGDIGKLPRIQVSGLRDYQAQALGTTFLRFILAHELAHAIEMEDNGPRDDAEMNADVLAARILAEDRELDGDLEMVETMSQMDRNFLRVAYRSAETTMKHRGTTIPHLSDDELASLDPSSDEFLAEVDRFASCSWAAAAVAATMLVLGGSGGYRSSSSSDSLERIAVVIERAFGATTRDAVLAEMDNNTALGMLRQVFVQGD